MAIVSETAIEVAKAITPLLPALIGIYTRTSTGQRVGKAVKEKARYTFISDFIDAGIDGRHPLIVEQAFAAHFGHKFDYEEIVALLQAKNPLRCFSLLKGARKVVTVGPSGRIEYERAFCSERSRYWHKKWYYFLYTLCMYVAVSLVMFASKLFEGATGSSIISLSLLVVFLLIMAFVFLDRAESMKYAEKLQRLYVGFSSGRAD